MRRVALLVTSLSMLTFVVSVILADIDLLLLANMVSFVANILVWMVVAESRRPRYGQNYDDLYYFGVC